MTDPELWADLAQKFLDLQTDTIGITVGWAYFPEGNRYVTWVDCPTDAQLARARFLILVAKAGVLLDQAKPSDSWLREISLQGTSNDRKSDRQIEPEGPSNQPVPCITGTVINPGETSVLICLKLQRWAIEQQSKKQPSVESSAPPSAAIRRAYRAEVRSWMKNEGITSVERAARTLGVSVSALKSIMTDKGQKRYGDDTLQRVLTKITHR